MKQSIYKCLSEYSTTQLVQFHANLTALFIGCTEDFNVLPLLMQVHFALSARESTFAKKYLDTVECLLNTPT